MAASLPPPPPPGRLLFSPTVLILLPLLLAFCSFPPVAPQSSAETSALLAFRDAVGRTLNWSSSTPACSWRGVQCDHGLIAELHLPGSSLVGAIPPNVLGNLTALQTLSLRYNALTGTLPADLASCVALRNLNLDGNGFSGGFPAVILSLPSLVQINLAGNSFSGEIPAGLNKLRRLTLLYLERNHFTGQIPELDIPSLAQFNVSFNLLNGSIPAMLRSQPREAFIGTSLCGGPLGTCLDESAANPQLAPIPAPAAADGKKKSKLSGGAVAGIVIGVIVGFMILALLFFILCSRGSKNRANSMESGMVKPAESELSSRDNGMGENGKGIGSASYPASAVAAGGVKAEPQAGNNKKLIFFSEKWEKVFDLEDLLRASAEVLGKGTFGTSYKAVLEMGTVVAVKRLKDVDLGEREFREKTEAIGKLQHTNIVPLRAYYYNKDEKLLVYDYMPMGSLSALLHGNRGAGRTPLNWETRLSIAHGTACGMEYVHSTGPGVSHGNIKSSNVLLTKSYEACISDHGLAHLCSSSSMSNRVTGYRAPEVTEARKISHKADVYSFGVLLLELLTGKAPAQAFHNEDGVDLLRWVQSFVREEWTSEVFDMELLRYQNVEEEMGQLLQLAIDCAAQHPDNRPTMFQVVARIEEITRSSMELSETDLQKCSFGSSEGEHQKHIPSSNGMSEQPDPHLLV